MLTLPYSAGPRVPSVELPCLQEIETKWLSAEEVKTRPWPYKNPPVVVVVIVGLRKLSFQTGKPNKAYKEYNKT